MLRKKTGNPKKGPAVLLLAPHSPEHFALLSLQKKLKEKLLTEGIDVRAKIIPGMMQRGWNARAMLIDRLKDDGDLLFSESVGGPALRDMLNTALSVEDLLIRTRAWLDFAEKNGQGAIIAELHASALGDSGEPLPRGGLMMVGWEKTSGVLCELDSMKTLTRIASGMEKKIRKIRSSLFSEVAEIFNSRGAEPHNAASEILEILAKIKELGVKLECFEAPAFRMPLPAGHPAWGLYSNRDYGSSMHFESRYCLSFYANHGPPSADVAALAKRLSFA
ncbi:MAG: hypothetical protein ABII71_02625 [Candidatus Micrarchaeota archaeon]